MAHTVDLQISIEDCNPAKSKIILKTKGTKKISRIKPKASALGFLCVFIICYTWGIGFLFPTRLESWKIFPYSTINIQKNKHFNNRQKHSLQHLFF